MVSKMRIFLLGATGKTGSIVLKEAINRGHMVTAYVRNAKRVLITNKNLNVVIGDLCIKEVSSAMKGHDVVISCLGGNDNDKATVITNMTKVIVDSMKMCELKRLVTISTAGIHNEFNLVTNIILKLFYKYVIYDHKLAAEHIMSSDLDYTLARPLSLTDGQLTKKYRTTSIGVPKGGKNISRNDLANFLIEVTENNNCIKETVGLAY